MENEEVVKDSISVFMEEDMFPDNDMSELVESSVYLSMVNAVIERCPEVTLEEAASRVDSVLDKLPGVYKLVKIEESEQEEF